MHLMVLPMSPNDTLMNNEYIEVSAGLIGGIEVSDGIPNSYRWLIYLPEGMKFVYDKIITYFCMLYL